MFLNVAENTCLVHLLQISSSLKHQYKYDKSHIAFICSDVVPLHNLFLLYHLSAGACNF
ncbi:hypothetical protein PAHAL_7G144200 [Panicum hallii]|uniref:Uncharacterized protein n=1 Tax=Panicum hallii TaxID=206008 RepID=A0A2T8IC98_9POAL|nr:hypothetical protein PAHAL_7G144200 [Panicum hallii]